MYIGCFVRVHTRAPGDVCYWERRPASLLNQTKIDRIRLLMCCDMSSVGYSGHVDPVYKGMFTNGWEGKEWRYSRPDALQSPSRTQVCYFQWPQTSELAVGGSTEDVRMGEGLIKIVLRLTTGLKAAPHYLSDRLT